MIYSLSPCITFSSFIINLITFQSNTFVHSANIKFEKLLQYVKAPEQNAKLMSALQGPKTTFALTVLKLNCKYSFPRGGLVKLFLSLSIFRLVCCRTHTQTMNDRSVERSYQYLSVCKPRTILWFCFERIYGNS